MNSHHCWRSRLGVFAGVGLLGAGLLAWTAGAVPSDTQKIGVWKGHKFEWQAVDGTLTNPVSLSIGVLFSTEGGGGTQARAYLFDRSPGSTITADVPSEAELRPAQWGEWILD